jgi:hypothetical protein
MKTQAILFVLAIGCGSSTKPAVQEPKPQPADVVQKPPAPACDAVAQQMKTVISREETPPADAELAAIGDTIKLRCTEDGWSAEVRECYGTVEHSPDAKGCDKLLTAEQREKLDKAIVAHMKGGAAEVKAADEAPPERRSRGGTPKKQVPKSSDPCMGGE